MPIKIRTFLNFFNFIFLQFCSKLTSYGKELYLLFLFNADPIYSNFILSYTIALTLPQFISSTIYNSLLREISSLKGSLNLRTLEREVFPKLFIVFALSFIFVNIGGHGNFIDYLLLSLISIPLIYFQIYVSILDSKLKNKYILFESVIPITIFLAISITKNSSYLPLFYLIGTLIMTLSMRFYTIYTLKNNLFVKNNKIKNSNIRIKGFELLSHAFIQSFSYLIFIIDYEFLSRVSTTDIPIYSFITKNIVVVASLVAYPVRRLVIAKADKIKIFLISNKIQVNLFVGIFIFLLILIFNFTSSILNIFNKFLNNPDIIIDNQIQIFRYGILISLGYFILIVLIAYCTKIRITGKAAICMSSILLLKFALLNVYLENKTLDISSLMKTNIIYYALSIFLIFIVIYMNKFKKSPVKYEN